MASIEHIREQLNKTNLTKIFFTDLNGRIMNLPINPDNIESIIANGIGFDGSSVAGYATVDSSDSLLFPDPESFQVVEFCDNNNTLGSRTTGVSQDILVTHAMFWP